MSSFPEIKLLSLSYLGQNASTHQSCNNLQTIQQELQILSAEGLLATIKVIPGWLCTNHSLFTSFGRVHPACEITCPCC